MFRDRSAARPHPYHNPVSHVSAAHRQQAQPVYNPAAVQPEEVQARQEEHRRSDALCRMCSDQGHQICHQHISSQAVRELASIYQGGYRFQCIMCRTNESIVRPDTRKIILTDSTLYNVWTYVDMKLLNHVDIESIVGDRVRDLTRALIMQFLKYPERLEIIVIVGLNNLGDSQPVPDILKELCELKQVVQAHSEVNNHMEASVVFISTVLYAPKLCALDLPKNSPEWVPPPGFINRRHDIECLNAAIAALNKSDHVNYLNMHYEGIRIDKKSGKKMHKHNPVQPVWREREVRRKLHLTPRYKVRVMDKVAKLFTGGLRNMGNWAK